MALGCRDPPSQWRQHHCLLCIRASSNRSHPKLLSRFSSMQSFVLPFCLLAAAKSCRISFSSSASLCGVNIDFGGHSAISRPMRLTDTMLASLNVRVNARNFTQSLTLLRTEKLRGFGLAPLILSQKLQPLRLEP